MAALKVMKMLDGQVAVGNKSNTKTIGEHKVSGVFLGVYGMKGSRDQGIKGSRCECVEVWRYRSMQV